jgi:biotin transport system substrate-specific component
MEIALKREIVSNKVLSRTIGVAAFVVLTALGAFVRVPLPFTPVPLTLQTFFVLLSGLVLGGGLGFLSQSIYLFLGLVGLSVFSGAGSGFLYLLGPTGGYFVGFLLASLIAARIRKGSSGMFRTLALLYLADLVLLACGAIWLKFAFNYSFAQAFAAGILPFLPGDLAKVLVASFFYLKVEKRVKNIF